MENALLLVISHSLSVTQRTATLHIYFTWLGGWGLGIGVSFLAKSSFLCPHHRAHSSPPRAPFCPAHTVLISLRVYGDTPPTGLRLSLGQSHRGVSAQPSCTRRRPPSFPALGTEPLPGGTMCSPVYEGQARTGPSGRQQEVGDGENVRTGGGGSCPDPWYLPAENWLRKARRAPITGEDLGQPSKGHWACQGGGRGVLSAWGF